MQGPEIDLFHWNFIHSELPLQEMVPLKQQQKNQNITKKEKKKRKKKQVASLIYLMQIEEDQNLLKMLQKQVNP